MKIVVIGGGAAGFFAAINCAQTNPNNHVILIEASQQPLGKVKISGGGRCNVTHHCFDIGQLITNYPRGGKALRGAFTRFQPQDTITWFNGQGVKLKTESDGRMFPITDSSETIVNCLIETAKKVGVKLITGVAVKNIETGFQVTLKTGEILTADKILIATGSSKIGYQWAEKLGHTIEKPVPSLFTFNIKDKRFQDLAGVSVENLYLKIVTQGKDKLEQTGPLLITHWGISGPAVLKLSAWGARILAENNYQMQLIINWLPEYNQSTLTEYLLQIKLENPKKQIASYSPVKLSKRLWQNLVIASEINPETIWTQLSKKQLNKLVQELVQGKYLIQGKGVFKDEFVTCGGVNLKEINFKTMESKICPNLYFAGEILDIDGITGGFNFQNAWTTGWIAGQAMTNYFLEMSFV
jgi:predicted Rossmann fold flavoprotein